MGKPKGNSKPSFALRAGSHPKFNSSKPSDEPKGTKKVKNHDVPLHAQIENDLFASNKQKVSKEVKRKRFDDNEESFVDKKLGKKILRAAREQQVEEQDSYFSNMAPPAPMKKNKSFYDSDDMPEDEDEMDTFSESSIPLDGPAYEGEIQVSAEDERALEMFLSKEHPEYLSLTKLMMDRIGATDKSSTTSPGLDPKIVEAFTTLGKILAQYRSGKLPKIFQVIPTLVNWDEIVYLTSPDHWTPQATYAAVRVFVSTMKPAQAQRFFYLVLLPKIRSDILANKKLNYHYFMALKKALYKPGAFYKGILLPLCKSRTCTLKEAVILGGILHKSSVPLAHSSAALLKIAEMEYSGATSIFIKVFCEKKYAFPYRVIDALVKHFSRFLSVNIAMPVLWHQSLLVFCQRFKEDFTTEQKEILKTVVNHHTHPKISPDILRELAVSLSRGDRHPLRIAMDRMQA